MNKKHFLWSLLSVACAALLLFPLGACSDDDTDGGGLQLYYSDVIDIGPSMNYVSGAPSYYGATPSEFRISRLTLDGAEIVSDSFAVNAASGVVTISNTDDLDPGTYRLSIGCMAGGAWYDFPDIFTAHMLPAVPAEVEVSAEVLEIPYEEVKSSDRTVTVTPVGETVSVIGYALLQEEGKEYFAISSDGVISVNTSYKEDIEPGIYPLDVKLSTYAGEALFADLVTVKVTSPALELTYTPASGRMEYNMGFTSAAPVMKGSPEQVSYAVKSVEPETDRIAIDPETGVISVEKDAELPEGARYAVEVTVENLYGSTDFAEAFVLEVIGYIAPIEEETFSYASVEVIQGVGFTAEKADGFVGDEVLFALGDLPDALQGQISIDTVTGTVTAAKGNSIPIGSYEIPVRVSNSKSEVETVFRLSVIENPYYFSYISYGNNLGLPELENASQFWVTSKDALEALNLTPTTDAKAGVALEWSLEIRVGETKYKTGGVGSTIDEATGVITPSGYSSGSTALLVVTATAGRGEEGQTTVSTPVFFSFSAEDAPVHYAPFVFRVNPRKGGTSVVPTISADIDPDMFSMDFRRDFYFWNLNGSSVQKDGLPADTGSFMNYMWGVYNAQEAVVTPIGTGAKGCVSAYENSSYQGKTLALALCYVDPETKAIVVNPNKWIDSEGNGANGVLVGQMTYLTNLSWTEITKANNTLMSNSTNTVTPVMIWFDENF